MYKEGYEHKEKETTETMETMGTMEQRDEEAINKMGLLSQVRHEYDEGYKMVSPKRDLYFERQRRESKKRNGSVITVDTVNDVKEAMLAQYFSDSPSAEFVSRDGYIHMDKADNWNALAQFDMDESNYHQLRYNTQSDRLTYGVGIRVKTGWDCIKSVPIYLSIDPMKWIPDPFAVNNGNYNGSDFRFHGFELQASYQDLKNAVDDFGNRLYDEEALRALGTDSQTHKQSALAVQDAGGYGPALDSRTDNFMCDIYYHYTVYDGRKYLVTTDGTRSLILRCVELPAVLSEEKKMPANIKFPVILNYFCPKRGDPFGYSLWDMLEDKQTQKSILANLQIIKAKKNAGLSDKIWNMNLVDKSDIMRPSEYGKNIFVTPKMGQSLTEAVYTIPQEQSGASTFNEMNFLDTEIAKRTGLDRQQYGLTTPGANTATEIQSANVRASMRSMLWSYTDMWGEKEFWRHWWRSYVEFFSKGDKKFVALNVNNIKYKSMEISKDSIATSQDPYIVIQQRSKVEEERNKLKLYYASILASIQNNPYIPAASKLNSLRMYMRYSGLSMQNVLNHVPYLPDELKAFEYVEMINYDIEPEDMVNESVPDERYKTYLIYIQEAKDTPAKWLAIDALKARIATIPQQPTEGTVPNQDSKLDATANMFMAKAMNEQSSPILQN